MAGVRHCGYSGSPVSTALHYLLDELESDSQKSLVENYVQQPYLQGKVCHLVFFALYVYPGMVMATLPGTHMGWWALPTQTLPKNPSLVLEDSWFF